jgi:transcriptional regulator with XRE-family HTH domain
MITPLPALAHVMRDLRAEQSVDQLGLGLATGASDGSYLSKLENGHARNPSVSFLARYVDAFRVLGRPLSNAQRDRLAFAVLADQPSAAVVPTVLPPSTTPLRALARGLEACAGQRVARADLRAVDIGKHRDLLSALALLALDLAPVGIVDAT